MYMYIEGGKKSCIKIPPYVNTHYSLKEFLLFIEFSPFFLSGYLIENQQMINQVA